MRDTGGVEMEMRDDADFHERRTDPDLISDLTNWGSETHIQKINSVGKRMPVRLSLTGRFRLWVAMHLVRLAQRVWP
jgi:hypothetical protein